MTVDLIRCEVTVTMVLTVVVDVEVTVARRVTREVEILVLVAMLKANSVATAVTVLVIVLVVSGWAIVVVVFVISVLCMTAKVDEYQEPAHDGMLVAVTAEKVVMISNAKSFISKTVDHGTKIVYVEMPHEYVTRRCPIKSHGPR